MVVDTARRRAGLLVVAALGVGALLLVKGGDGAGVGSGGNRLSELIGAPGSQTAKGAGKVTPALQQQIGAAGTAARQVPYSGGAPTRADGRIEVVFHAAGPVGDTELDVLRSHGAEIVDTLADDPLVPRGAGIVVAWIAPDQIFPAAAADWVSAVTPPSFQAQR